MKSKRLDRPTIKIVIGVTALIGVLVYNWTHTGGLLASYVDPAFVGYIAAGGIELAIVGLSLRIGELRLSKADTRFFVVTLIAVVIVSALANVAEGYTVKFGETLTLFNIQRLDIVQAIVSLSATGLLSLVTFALAEIVGNDLTAVQVSIVDVTSDAPAINDAEQPAADNWQSMEMASTVSPEFNLDSLLASTGLSRDDAVTLIQRYGLTADRAYHSLRNRLPAGLDYLRFAKLFSELTGAISLTDVTSSPVQVTDPGVVVDTAAFQPEPSPPRRARSEIDITKSTALNKLIEHLSNTPDATITELANLIGKSRATVYNYLDELETTGKVHRNGHITTTALRSKNGKPD